MSLKKVVEDVITSLTNATATIPEGRDCGAVRTLLTEQVNILRKALTEEPKGLLVTSGYFIGGPSASVIVSNKAHVEAVISALSELTGDDNDDYTCTDLSNPLGTPHENA